MTMFTRQDAAQMHETFFNGTTHPEEYDEIGDMHSALNAVIAPRVEAMIAAARAEASQGLPPGFRAQAALAVFAAKSGTEHASTSVVSTAYRAAQAVRAADMLIAELAKEPQE